eukprot:PhM_4_TR8733/c0_g1_i1/m.82555/K14440/SMARCAL1, HARP; SWI/SNF-related matrix-associated actin-dependent regulator of chromatin subfamily A-like protein 1
MSGALPPCKCSGRQSVLRTVQKDGPNKGKRFAACSAYPGCGFFMWWNGPEPTSSTTNSITAPPGPPALTSPSIALRSTATTSVLQVKCEVQLYFELGSSQAQDMVSVTFPSAAAVAAVVQKLLRERRESFGTRELTPQNFLIPIQSYPEMCRALEGLARGTPPCPVEIEHVPKHVFQAYDRAKQVTRQDLDVGRIPEFLLSKLRPFQRDGVQFVIDHNGRAMIGDEMGLGKTVQAIASASYYSSEWPLMILCPCSLKGTWKRELTHWLPMLEPSRIFVLSANVSGVRPPDGTLVIIVPYSLVCSRQAQLLQLNIQVAIVDESHYLKNYRAKRTTAVANILRSTRRVILLSGTPAVARPLELLSQVNFLMPGFFSFTSFTARYCNGHKNGMGVWDTSGHSHLKELQWLLHRTVLIRRKKETVLKELPNKIRQEVPIEVTATERGAMQRELTELRKRMAEQRGKPSSSVSAPDFSNLKSSIDVYYMSAKAKAPGVCEYLSDLMETGEKFLVFAHHLEMLNAVEKVVKKHCDAEKWEYIRIDGSTPEHGRSGLVEHFRTTEDCKVAILSMLAAGTGLTFTPCSNVVFTELHWTPAILAQCEDRVHRIGQKNCCTAKYLLAQGTIDEILWPILQAKLEVTTTSLDVVVPESEGNNSHHSDENKNADEPKSGRMKMDERVDFARKEDFVNVVSYGNANAEHDATTPSAVAATTDLEKASTLTLDRWFKKTTTTTDAEPPRRTPLIHTVAASSSTNGNICNSGDEEVVLVDTPPTTTASSTVGNSNNVNGSNVNGSNSTTTRTPLLASLFKRPREPQPQSVPAAPPVVVIDLEDGPRTRTSEPTTSDVGITFTEADFMFPEASPSPPTVVVQQQPHQRPLALAPTPDSSPMPKRTKLLAERPSASPSIRLDDHHHHHHADHTMTSTSVSILATSTPATDISREEPTAATAITTTTTSKQSGGDGMSKMAFLAYKFKPK